MQKKHMRTIAAAAGVLALALVFWFAGSPLFGPAGPVSGADFQVHFIDVGQGDCELILVQGHAMLIDGGERGNEDKVTKYLVDQGVSRLDYVVATHPHSDHMGGLAYGILESFPVGTVIAPRLSAENTPDTRTYEAFLNAVSRLVEQGTKAAYAQPGQEYPLGDAVIRILGPLSEDRRNYNNDSVIIQVLYKNTSALFMGDGEKAVENALIGQWGDTLRADLLKAGHHGSKTSSNEKFLKLVNPSALVITCGAGNSYGHPSPEVLERCKAMNISVLRTDIDGTIVFVSDGKKLAQVK